MSLESAAQLGATLAASPIAADLDGLCPAKKATQRSARTKGRRRRRTARRGRREPRLRQPMTTLGPVVEQAHNQGFRVKSGGPEVVCSAAEERPLASNQRGARRGSLRSVVDLGAGFFDGALWARFESRRVTERRRGDKAARRASAGQRLVSSDERSCRQRIALTLSTFGVFPMTHHVECVALLERT